MGLCFDSFYQSRDMQRSNDCNKASGLRPNMSLSQLEIVLYLTNLDTGYFPNGLVGLCFDSFYQSREMQRSNDCNKASGLGPNMSLSQL